MAVLLFVWLGKSALCADFRCAYIDILSIEKGSIYAADPLTQCQMLGISFNGMLFQKAAEQLLILRCSLFMREQDSDTKALLSSKKNCGAKFWG